MTMQQDDALPFFPPLEPEQMRESITTAAQRVIEARKQIWAVLCKYMVGFREQPPAARWAWYVLHDQLAAPFAVWAQQAASISPEAAEEVAWMARDYAGLIRQKQREAVRTA